jgi:hypothetical protein
MWKQTQVQDQDATGKRMPRRAQIRPALGEAANLSGLAEQRQSALRELLQKLLDLVDDLGVDVDDRRQRDVRVQAEQESLDP